MGCVPSRQLYWHPQQDHLQSSPSQLPLLSFPADLRHCGSASCGNICLWSSECLKRGMKDQTVKCADFPQKFQVEISLSENVSQYVELLRVTTWSLSQCWKQWVWTLCYGLRTVTLNFDIENNIWHWKHSLKCRKWTLVFKHAWLSQVDLKFTNHMEIWFSVVIFFLVIMVTMIANVDISYGSWP